MIPKIDVRGLAAKKIYAGELSFEFEEEGLLDIPYVEFSSPVRAELHYEITEDNTVEVTGSVAFSLKGACSRCLSETEKRFSESVEGVFEPGKGDGESYGYNGVVVLDEFLRDCVAFALPPRLLCGACENPDGEQE